MKTPHRIYRTRSAVRNALLVLLTAVSAADLCGQSADTARGVSPQIIDTVIILGNRKTKDYVIRDEMTLKPGMKATDEAIDFDRGRIYSLGLFTRVDLEYQRIDTTGYLIVDVNERWYIFPVPIFGFRDGDPKKVYYGAGIAHTNFRGANQRIFFTFTLGFDPSVAFEFFDPLFDRTERLYWGAGLSASSVRNRSELETAYTGDFDEQHYDAHAILGKRFNLYEVAGFRAGYNVVAVTQYRTGRTASPTGRDESFYGGLEYAFDSRNLREYATRGGYFYASATKYGFGESDVDYARFLADLRKYWPLFSDLSLASRIYASCVTGAMVPTYARTYVGYGDYRVRGWYTTVFEGENMAGGTLELRFEALRARTIDLTSLPIPEQFAHWRFGISLAVFGDVGTAWFRHDVVTLSSFASGYGAGIHFLLPYSFVCRVEYAWNEYGHGQFIFDLRTSL